MHQSFELLVVGGTPAGVSLAGEARRSGLDSLLVVCPSGTLVAPALAERQGLPLHATPHPILIAPGVDDGVLVSCGEVTFVARVGVLDRSGWPVAGEKAWAVPPEVAHRVHSVVEFDAGDRDVLVAGGGEAAAVTAWQLAASGARVVVSFTGRLADLSLLARQMLEELEREQRATILWRSTPASLVAVGGFPMAVFEDRRTPDLQFDHVVVAASGGEAPGVGLAAGAEHRVVVISELAESGHVRPAEAWPAVRNRFFPQLPLLRPTRPTVLDEQRRRELASEHYNATITGFDTAHNELWRIRVRPDHPGVVHRAGQYCSLGLGYWEPRADDAEDPGLERRRERLIRRSYSISSPIFDPRGYLVDPAEMDEVELYIVWVKPERDRVPALTPRLALKQPGDRIYLGPKVAGRYTLAPVEDPSTAVVFCATGTGEAPHNAMLVELLRKGHHGPILSAVSVRYRSDLAYVAEHRRLEERFPNYRYLPVPTREPGEPKRYLQDLLQDGSLEEGLGAAIDPDSTHLFLCGNPAMIGLPSWEDDSPSFPELPGMCELLHRRGFVLDRRGVTGNVHYEEYW